MKLCVLNLRGLGAGHVGPYGNRWIDTPSLNALASQAIVFDRHLSAHPHVAGAVWRSGCHCFAPKADEPDLVALLTSAGVATDLVGEARPFADGWADVRHPVGLAATVAAGRERLSRLRKHAGDALLWIEFAALLPPWDVKEEFVTPYFTPTPLDDDPDEPDPEPLQPLCNPPEGPMDAEDDLLFEVIQTTYAAAVTQLDAALADLLDGLPDDVGLLVTSDAGQSLGERGIVGGLSLHREVVQVPLLLRLPGGPSRRRVGALTASIDVGPTVAEVFGLSLPGAHGRSLLPLLSSSPTWRDYVCLGTESERGLWTDELTLHVPRSAEANPRLYLTPDDRHEVNDVYQHRSEEADALARTLRAYVEATAEPGPLSVPAMPTDAGADNPATP